MEFVLASSSPRRRALLEQVGLKFEIVLPETDENIEPCEADDMVLRLAQRKAGTVSSVVGNEKCVIAADTVVSINGIILGKPENEKHAFEMLKLLSGRDHAVFTGICVCKGNYCYSDVCKTKVFFRNLTEKQIKSYIATGEPADKAGAYGIQGIGSLLIEKIEGDYFNVMGLPIVTLDCLLNKLGAGIL